MKLENQKPRDQWIQQSWTYNGAGYQENKKKKLPRKQKYKEKYL